MSLPALDQANYAMAGAHSQHVMRLERYLPLLKCCSKLALVWGGVGSVVPLMHGLRRRCHSSEFESLFIQALIPLFAGILVSAFLFGIYRWLSASTNRFEQQSEAARSDLLQALRKMDQLAEVERKPETRIKRRRITPLLIPKLWHLQTWVIGSMMLFLLYISTPFRAQQPSFLNTPSAAAARVLRPDLHPGIWITHDGTLKMSNGKGTYYPVPKDMVATHIQAVTWENARPWLLYINGESPYGEVEDLLSHLRSAGVNNIHFMTRF